MVRGEHEIRDPRRGGPELGPPAAEGPNRPLGESDGLHSSSDELSSERLPPPSTNPEEAAGGGRGARSTQILKGRHI